MLSNIYLSFNINIIFKNKLKVFKENIVHYGFLFVCENFQEKIPIKINIF
jgi:hypothetical protein